MNFFELLFPDFSLIVIGWLVCRYTALGRDVWQRVDGLVYYFLFPVLLFQAIVRKPLDLQATSSMIAAGLTLAATGIAMAYAIPHLPWLRRHVDIREHAASAQVAFRFNSYITLAIVERVAAMCGKLASASVMSWNARRSSPALSRIVVTGSTPSASSSHSRRIRTRSAGSVTRLLI